MKKFIFTVILTALLAAFGCKNDSPSSNVGVGKDQEKNERTIVAVGDSLTAGLGLAEEDAYPALLEKRLQKEGHNFRVVNAGVSAETSSGTLARMEWILTLSPEIVILETGANDGLRGIEPQVMEKNLREILGILKEKKVTVVLAGMQMVRNLGPEYVARFNAIYPRLAKESGAVYMPFFLEGVAMHSDLNQADGIHPTTVGYQKVVDNLYPYVLEAIKKSRNPGK